MKDLDWLVQHRFEALTRCGHDWVFAFSGNIAIVTQCLWRLIEGDRVRVTGEDHGQKFGLPEPLDAVAKVNSRLIHAAVIEVDLKEGTLDLRIKFDSGIIIELLPNSSGYEAWNVSRDHQQFIATGGGELVIFGDVPSK